MQRLLDAMTMAPAYVRNGRMDVLAANRLGRAVFAPLFDSPATPTNLARFIFLDPAAAGVLPGMGSPGQRHRRAAAGRGRA